MVHDKLVRQNTVWSAKGPGRMSHTPGVRMAPQ